MHYKTREELVRKVGLFGLSDLRKLAPIGDLGYENGWYPPFFVRKPTWAEAELPKAIMEAFWEQKEKYGWTVESGTTGWRCTDHWSSCPELRLTWRVDSGD